MEGNIFHGYFRSRVEVVGNDLTNCSHISFESLIRNLAQLASRLNNFLLNSYYFTDIIHPKQNCSTLLIGKCNRGSYNFLELRTVIGVDKRLELYQPEEWVSGLAI